MTAATMKGLSAAGAELGAFLRWWRAELAEMLPARLRRSGPRAVLDLRGGGTPVVLGAARSGGGGGWRALAPFPGGAAARRALAAEDRIVLAVPPDWILRRVLHLPAAAEARLDAVLEFELEQHIPFPAEAVLRAARVLRRQPEAQRIEVEVAVLPRALIAPAAAAVRAAGLAAPLLARTEPGAEWPSLPLDALAPPRRRWRRWIEAGAALAAALLTGHLALAELNGRAATVAAVEARAAAARAGAERVLALEAEAAALRARLAAAAELRGGRPPAVAVLEELARLLPDDVWLTDLRLTGEELVASGFAGRSDALLELLDASPLFREPRFAAPVTRGQRDAADRFQVALRVAPKPGAAPPSPSPVQTVQR